MVKHKIPADVQSLADRYFCEQCDRLGLPRPPEHPKPLKAPKHPFKPRKPTDVDQLAETGVWINTRVDPVKLAKDTADGLAIEAMLLDTRLAPLGGQPAPRMGLEAILRAYNDGEDR